MDVCRKTLCGTLLFPSSPLNPRPLLIVFSGLPGSGKTAIATSLRRYLSWINQDVRIFNAGSLRRDNSSFGKDALDFLDTEHLDKIADAVLSSIMEWINSPSDMRSTAESHSDKIRGGTTKIAIFDATNSTPERRENIVRMAHHSSVQVLFIESLLPTLTFEQFSTTKWLNHAHSDYVNFSTPESAYLSFLNRVNIYKTRCQHIASSGQDGILSFIRIHGKGTTSSLIDGYLPLRISNFITNNHRKVKGNVVYLTRHGESVSDIMDIIGGDSELTENGRIFGKELGKYLAVNEPNGVSIWTSTLKRTIQTAKECIDSAGGTEEELQWPCLDEIHAGYFEGQSYDLINKHHSDVKQTRESDKFNYIYPGRGESYALLAQRLEPLLMSLERQESNILVITHRATLRMIRAYLCDLHPADEVNSPVPLHKLYKIQRGAYSSTIEEISISPSTSPLLKVV